LFTVIKSVIVLDLDLDLYKHLASYM